MGSATWTDLRARLGRLIAVGLSTGLGVAFIATSSLVLASAHRGVENAVAAPYVNADLVVLSTGDGLSDAMLAKVAATPGVAGSAGLVSVDSAATWEGSRGSHYVEIAQLSDDAAMRWQALAAGAYPSGTNEVIVATDEAKALDLHVGDVLNVNGSDGAPHDLRVVGEYTGGLASRSSGFAATDDAIRELDSGGYLSEIVVRTKTAQADAVSVALQQAVGDNGQVVPAAVHVDALVSGMTSDVDVLGMLLLGFSAIAMFVSALVIANTFAVVLAQRTRELALLRCIGAARGQLLRSVLTEAAVLGAGAGAVGVGAGIGLAALMVVILKRVQTTYPLAGIAPTFGLVIVPLLIGLVVTVLAAIVPARRATQVAPLAALRPAEAISVHSRPGVLRLAAATAAIVMGGGALALGTASSSLPLGMLGGVVSFVGVLLAAPILVPAVVRLLGVGVARSGVPGRLAVTNAVRNPRRTAATCSALLVGVTLISMMTVGAASLQRSEAAALDEQLPVDLVVDGGDQALPATIAGGVAGIDGVNDVAELRGATIDVAGSPVRVLGVDPREARDVVRGDAVDGLVDGTALLQWSVADQLGVTDGDTVNLGDGVTLRVVVANALETPAAYVTSTDLARLDPGATLSAVWAQVDDDVSARAVTASAQDLIASVPDASVGGAFTLRADYEDVFAVLLLVATALLAVALLIALVGVGNTMSLSVVERTREHAVLRAIGLTRKQLVGTLATESLLLAATAGVLGVGLGIVYGIAGAATLFGSITDHMLFAIPWGQLGLLVLVASGAGLVASVLPARRAARTPPAAALGDG